MEALQRLPDWHSRLVRSIEAVRREPFVWGNHDCGMDWAGRAVEAVTGIDLTAPYRTGRGYKTARGALSVMKRAGFDNLADLAGSHLPEIHPSQAIMGDIAAVKVDTPFGYALGVVNGASVLILGEQGMRVIELLNIDRAFAVGERF